MTCHQHIHAVCIRFLLNDVYQFESTRLSDMSNHFSYGYQHIVTGGSIGTLNFNWNFTIIIVLQLIIALLQDTSIKFN
jgi:hypothetical protein